MSRPGKPTVPKSIRIGSFILAVILTFLLVWLLGFFLRDLGQIDGPNYQDVRSEFVDRSLERESQSVRSQIAELEKQAKRQSEIQQDLKRGMDNARETMQQMMDLHRLSLEKQATPTEDERDALATSQQRFLEAQNRFEEANIEIARLNSERFDHGTSLEKLDKELKKQEGPARGKYNTLSQKHQLKLASFKLALIVPLFGLSVWWFFKKRQSPFRLIPLAALAATFWKLGVVMHVHFPREFFKYIVIAAGIAAVLVFLVWLLRRAARPDQELLLNRYREGYRGHNCPVCAFPILRGPLKFAIWTRKGPQFPQVSLGAADVSPVETPYACPSCGTALFEACHKCGGSRHSLLPFCEHCGTENQTEVGEA